MFLLRFSEGVARRLVKSPTYILNLYQKIMVTVVNYKCGPQGLVLGLEEVDQITGVEVFAICKIRPVRLNLSARLISHGTVFFSHNKTASAGLLAAETISRTTLLIDRNDP